MNLKNMTIVFMLVIVYTILNKLGHNIAPSLFEISSVFSITKILTWLSRIVVFIFLILFYLDQVSYGTLKKWFIALIVCLLVTLLFSIPIVINLFGHMNGRLVRLVFGFVVSILFFVVLILYKKQLPVDDKVLIKTGDFLTIVLGAEVIKSLLVLIEFGRFYFTGFMTEHSIGFYQGMLIYFFISQGILFWFLYRFYKYRFKTF